LLETIIQETKGRTALIPAYPAGDRKIPLLAEVETPQQIQPVDPGDSQVIWNLKRVFEDAVRAMGQMMEVRDPYTAGHQSRVAQICVEIARLMKLTSFQSKGLELAALVHDVGKMAIPS
jgi:HD-GYP domain-containing protein (c-di-GMP phosphodiesterase class II)